MRSTKHISCFPDRVWASTSGAFRIVSRYICLSIFDEVINKRCRDRCAHRYPHVLLLRDAMHKRGLYRHAMSVCLSVVAF